MPGPNNCELLFLFNIINSHLLLQFKKSLLQRSLSLCPIGDGSADFSNKGPGPRKKYCRLHKSNYSTQQLQHKKSLRQYINYEVWLYPNKIHLYNTGADHGLPNPVQEFEVLYSIKPLIYHFLTPISRKQY